MDKKQKESKRAELVRILQAVSPDVDFSDDEVLFDRIIADRNARIEDLMEARPPSDGAPHLSGGGGQGAWRSLFDLADC